MKQLHADLMSLGYEGSYNRVAAFAREWRDDRQRELQTTGRGTYLPLAFDPGEAFQFDWSEDWAIIGNERTRLQVAHTKLSYSRACVVRAYLLQTQEMLFDAHNHAFRVFGGIPGRGTTCGPRSTRSAVARSVTSMSASRRWPVTTCSNPSSAIRLQAGRKDRSRRMCRMRVTASSNLFRAFHRWMP